VVRRESEGGGADANLRAGSSPSVPREKPMFVNCEKRWEDEEGSAEAEPRWASLDSIAAPDAELL
jgi:hypothetical protein